MSDAKIVETRECTTAVITISRDEMESMMTAALVRAFRDIGLDAKNPQDVFELRKDLGFLREWRGVCELARNKGIIGAMLLLLAAMGTLLVLGVRFWLLKGG